MTATVTPLLRAIPLPEGHDSDPAARAEWLDLRRPYIGCSEIAALFGDSPYTTIADLVAEKVHGVEVEQTKKMALGIRLEDAIAQAWADEHGVTVTRPDHMYARGRLIGTIDREIVGSHSDHLEVKLTTDTIKTIPAHWWHQAQGQMGCRGSERTHFAVVDADHEIKSFVVARDDEHIARIDAAVDAFWAALDLGMDPEPIVRERCDETIEVADGDRAVLVEWMDAKQAADEAEARLDAVRPLVEAMADAGGMVPGSKRLLRCGDLSVRVSMRAGRRRFDTKALRRDHPDIADAYEGHGDPYTVLEAK